MSEQGGEAVGFWASLNEEREALNLRERKKVENFGNKKISFFLKRLLFPR